MASKTKAKPGEKRGNKSKEPRYPKDENGVRHPTEKQLEVQANLKEIAKYNLDNDVAGIIGAYAEVMTRAKIDTNDPQQVEANIVNYINTCAERNIKPTAEGLATSIGVARMSVYNWINGINKKPQEVIDVLNFYMSMLNTLHVQYMVEGKVNPVSGIFIAKNNFENYKDQQEMKFTTNSIASNETTEQLADKYKETMAIDITNDIVDV